MDCEVLLVCMVHFTFILIVMSFAAETFRIYVCFVIYEQKSKEIDDEFDQSDSDVTKTNTNSNSKYNNKSNDRLETDIRKFSTTATTTATVQRLSVVMDIRDRVCFVWFCCFFNFLFICAI